MTGEPDFLSTHETGEALRALSSDGQNPLDIVFYDACLMGMLEEVYEIRNYADYLIASENIAWATFPYDYYINAIAHTTIPEELAQSIAQNYIQSLPATYAGTIAVYDLSYADDIAAQANAFANALIVGQENADVREQIGEAYLLSQKVDYDSNGEIISDREGYVDLYDFAFRIEALVSVPNIKAAAQTLLAALSANEFLLFEAHQSGQWNLSGINGLSIYLPFGEELYIGSECVESTTDPCAINSDAGCLKLRDFYTTVTPPQTIQLAFTQNTNWDEFVNGFIDIQYCSPELTNLNSDLPETRIITILNSPRQGNLLTGYTIYTPFVASGD